MDELSALLDSVRERAHEVREVERGARVREDRTALVRARMLESILELHAALGTGYSRERLVSLAEGLRSRACLLDMHEGLEERINGFVLCRLYRELGEVAWERLMALGVEWPDPPYVRPEDVERAREWHLAEARKAFVAMPAAQAADLILGVVKVWGAIYPDPGTALWRELGLEAVAAAFRAELYLRAFSLWEARSGELESLVSGVLEKALSKGRELLASGVQTVAEADRVASETCRVVREELPEAVWDYLRTAGW